MPELQPPLDAPDEAGDPSDVADVVLVPARFNERLIAYLLDAAPFMVGYILTALYALPLLGGARAARPLGLAWLALYLAYHSVGNMMGATVGKRLMGLRVVRRDGEPLGPGRSILRAFGHLASSPLADAGFLLALFHPESRAFHDLLAGSLVVEPERKHPAEATLLFAAAALTLGMLYAAMLYIHLGLPTPHDREAIAKAREGLGILAQIEEVYKQDHSYYTDSLAELAKASGDPEQFRDAMLELFDPHEFKILSTRDRYRISGVALDRRRTRVILEGPPPHPVE